MANPNRDIDMTPEQLQAFVEAHRWKFARSMARNPHWYTLSEWTNRALFEQFVMTMRRNGHDRWFWRKQYRHLDIGAWTYWTMGDPLETTILINRKPLAAYDMPTPHEVERMCANPFLPWSPRPKVTP